MKLIYSSFIFCFIVLITSCTTDHPTLPILGHRTVVNGDTVYHKIPDFEFLDVDSVTVTNNDLEDKIYVADFFFTSCPSICPKVKKQMLRLYDRYENEEMLHLVSHTIDPKRDSPSRLKLYAKNLGVNTKKWLFLTGEQDSLLGIADDYFVSAFEDPEVPGGFDHSGKIILVDKERHIRGVAEGTDPESVTAFFKTIDALLYEYRSEP